MTEGLTTEGLTTDNFLTERLDKLQTLFPDIFSEGKIDWEKLKATFSDDPGEGINDFLFFDNQSNQDNHINHGSDKVLIEVENQHGVANEGCGN